MYLILRWKYTCYRVMLQVYLLPCYVGNILVILLCCKYACYNVIFQVCLLSCYVASKLFIAFHSYFKTRLRHFKSVILRLFFGVWNSTDRNFRIFIVTFSTTSTWPFPEMNTFLNYCLKITNFCKSSAVGLSERPNMDLDVLS
jgi:hypothetical protein